MFTVDKTGVESKCLFLKGNISGRINVKYNYDLIMKYSLLNTTEESTTKDIYF